ncbi:hypothetical protein PPYR_03036 [Photinus pyralis]|uniref:Tyr recombinase domain-containing protein n=1 Tax=Photinus pyralis TaxID=7054 RepID=A0A5N4A1R0_PHOPY|nr:hypothetical protein PPYR_03036 [Photinus pyralis]
MLLALATGQRVQTLASIEINNIRRLSDKIEIPISKRIKTSRVKRIQPTLILPFFDDNISICPARTLLLYLKETHSFRDSVSSFFITYKKPYRAATSQTISRWLKTGLRQSGVDTSHFGAHSTRHASTSLASKKGISFDTIRLAAGWTEKSKAFALFYNRPIVTDAKHVYQASNLKFLVKLKMITGADLQSHSIPYLTTTNTDCPFP